MSLLRIKQADGSWSNIPAIKGADGIDGKDGAIQYAAGRYIQIDEDTQTINCTVKIGDLVIIDAVPVKDSTNVVSSGGVYDALEAKADKTEIAGLGGEAGFITNSVEDLKNYYKKSETYSQEEVNSLIGNLTRLTLQVVQTLPEVGTEHIIYLVPNNDSGNNIYEEWIFVQSKWEMIGTTEVDFSNYYTKEEVDALIGSISAGDEFHYIDITQGYGGYSYIFTPTTGNGNISNDILQQFCDYCNTHTLDPSNSQIHYFEKPLALRINKTKVAFIDHFSTGTMTGGYPVFSFYFNTLVRDSYGGTVEARNRISVKSTVFNLAFNVVDGKYTILDSLASSNNWKTYLYKDYLAKDNTSSYTPSSDYHPATKKYVDDKVQDAIPQKSTMPTASATYLNKIYQYIGEDTEEFTKGFFYQCISTVDGETTTYAWNEIKFASGTEVPAQYPWPVVTITGTLKAEGGTSYDPESKSYTSAVGKELLEKLNAILEKGITKVLVRMIITDNNTIPYLETILTMTGTYPSYVPIIIPRFVDDISYLTPQMQFPLQIVNGKVTNRTNTSDVIRIYSWMNSANNKTIIATTNDVLTKNNTTAFTPDADYEPATKKYVDDAVAAAGGGSGEGQDLSNYYTKDEVNALPLQDDLGVHVIVSDFGGSNPYWADASSDVAVKFMDKLTELYKAGAPVSTIRIHTGSTSAAYWECRVGFNGSSPNIEPVMTFLYDSSGAISQRRLVKCDYGTFYYDTEAQKFAHSAGNAMAFFSYTGDPGIYTKASDVLTKTNTTEYTPASAYHPATKQYVDQTVASAGGITEESDPTVPLYVKNITQDMISKWNTVEDKLTKEELAESAGEAGLITLDSINYPIIIKGRYNVDVLKYSGEERVTPKILDYTIDESAMPFINTALRRILKIKQDTGESLISTNSFGDYVLLYMPLDISVLVNLLPDATINYEDYDNPSNDYLKTVAINSSEVRAFTPSISDCLDGHRAILSVQHYLDPNYQSFDDITITFKEIYADYNHKDINLRISSEITYNSEYDFELHTLSLRENTALMIDKRLGTVIPTSTSDLSNDSGFVTNDDIVHPDLWDIIENNNSNYYEDPEAVYYHADKEYISALPTVYDHIFDNLFIEFELPSGYSKPSQKELSIGVMGGKLAVAFEKAYLGHAIFKTYDQLMETKETVGVEEVCILAETKVNITSYSTLNVRNYNRFGQQLESSYTSLEGLLGPNGTVKDRVFYVATNAGPLGCSILIDDNRVMLVVDEDSNKHLEGSATTLKYIRLQNTIVKLNQDLRYSNNYYIIPWLNSVSSTGKISNISIMNIDLTADRVTE